MKCVFYVCMVICMYTYERCLSDTDLQPEAKNGLNLKAPFKYFNGNAAVTLKPFNRFK